MTASESTALKETKKGQAAPEGEEAGKRSRLSWAVGWVLVPGTLLALIFAAGALIGVHLHDSWLSRLIVWVVELFS